MILRILIFGAGNVGASLAKRLSDAGHVVTIIDKDEEKTHRVAEMADVESISGDAMDPKLYEKIDLASYDVVVAATDKDEINMFIAALSKMYGVKRIYVRVRNEQTLRVLRSIGITNVIVEPQIIATIFFHSIEGLRGPITLLPVLSGDFVLIANMVKSTSTIRGKKLDDLFNMLGPNPLITVIGIYDGDRLVEPELVKYLEEGHVVISLVHKDFIEDYVSLF